MYSADPGKFCDETFIGEIHSERKNREFPEGVLPFARDGGGSVVYLDLSSDGKGRVVAFVEGLPEWTGLRTKSAFIELAPSFDAYVDLLRINREHLVERLAGDASELRHVIATGQFLDIGIPSWREDRVLSAAVDEARRRVSRA